MSTENADTPEHRAKTVLLTAHVPADLRRAVKLRAAELDSTLSALVIEALTAKLRGDAA